LLQPELMGTWYDTGDRIRRHEVVAETEAGGGDGGVAIVARSIHTSSKAVIVVGLACRRDRRRDCREFRAFYDEISRSELDVSNLGRLDNLCLLVERCIRSCVEPEILREVEQKARLVTQLRVICLPLVTSVTSNDVRLLVSGINLDLHQYKVLALILVLLSIGGHLHFLVVALLLLD